MIKVIYGSDTGNTELVIEDLIKFKLILGRKKSLSQSKRFKIWKF